MKKKAQGKKGKPNGMVDFFYGNTSYQIDPNRRKVYHRWIEVETARTSLIMSAWSQTQAPVRKAV